MRYLLIQSGDGYREYPVMEKKDSKEEGEAGGWQLICGGVEGQKVRSDERVFCIIRRQKTAAKAYKGGIKMVYDCIPFFNELDILKLRLHILAPLVDKFIIE